MTKENWSNPDDRVEHLCVISFVHRRFGIASDWGSISFLLHKARAQMVRKQKLIWLSGMQSKSKRVTLCFS